MVTYQQAIEEILLICQTPKTGEEIAVGFDKISIVSNREFAELLEKFALEIRVSGISDDFFKVMQEWINNTMTDREQRRFFFFQILKRKEAIVFVDSIGKFVRKSDISMY